MKLSLHGRIGAIALTGALALSLAACGSDDPTGSGDTTDAPAQTSELSGDLNGAGATSQEKAMDAWRAGFQSANPDVNINYDPVGSGGGRTQFLDGSVDFAGSDSALSAEELESAKAICTTEAIDLPQYISPIAVVFNLEGVTELNLSAATIAGIFDNKITTWDAPEIAAENPDATLPATAITPVHRSDESGTTKNFTDYLAKASGGAWTYEADGNWPFQTGESAQGTSGVIQAVQGADGTIAYADNSAVGTLGVASIKVGEEWVAPSEEGAAAAVDASPRDDERAEHDIVIKIDRETTQAGAYPLILISYGVACLQYDTAEKADLVKGFLSYVVSAEGQAAAEEAAGSAPLSDALRTDVQAAIDAITAAA
ncbi:phosphate ABC transporter substrate-binding protein PstS [Cellulomonas sp. Root137]|uniref:phosphate ABC transporter substrate-binding protein PstS n=1 Tax=Cellulomonas sp. Root137 TaxID=1736459 RepID=UPI0006F415CA|nr:phosphate ABC transporter substrate-binding protein PstS [Cellulomonas sp. Root137]KQY46028.1 phosphate ABC transporter substrate-binding protein [Cellulomonas sp. Root137]KRD43180.1 phosphate ABC transporter substrate-binding protein [Cellulomonas sp. Root930]